MSGVLIQSRVAEMVDANSLMCVQRGKHKKQSRISWGSAQVERTTAGSSPAPAFLYGNFFQTAVMCWAVYQHEI